MLSTVIVSARARARTRSQRCEKQVIDRKSKGREVTENGFPLTFSRNFSRHVRALDAPSFFELFHSRERRNARARPAKFLWNLSLGPSQVQIRLFAREMHPTSRIIILTDRDSVVPQSSLSHIAIAWYHRGLNASTLISALLVCKVYDSSCMCLRERLMQKFSCFIMVFYITFVKRKIRKREIFNLTLHQRYTRHCNKCFTCFFLTPI